MKISVPNVLSFLATNDFHGYVPGINDLLNGYTKPDGTREPSADEKIERGQIAITALQNYRLARKNKDDAEAQAQLKLFRENEQYFGYGYVKDKHDLVPSVPINFYAFRLMVGLGCLFILFFAIVVFYVYKKDITKPRWLLVSAIVMVPLAYIASESGWLVAEFGRQPWTIQDMLPTWAAVSNLHSSSVMITFFIFLALFTTMLAVEISILLKQIKKGPKMEGEVVN